MDTAALLGGNEYLVSQMLEKLSQTAYSPEERSALDWAIQRLSPEDSTRLQMLRDKEEVHQGVLTEMFTEKRKKKAAKINARKKCSDVKF